MASNDRQDIPSHIMSGPDRVFSRPDVEQLIADGRTIIIVDGYVLKLDCWLKFHPGGDKAILHMVGRDATDEVNAYVPSTQSLCYCLVLMFAQASLLPSSRVYE